MKLCSLVKSSVRTMQVLEYFDSERTSATVSDISDYYKWPQSSTSALIRTLVTMGYLAYEERKKAYAPTIRIALLGDWINSSLHNNKELNDIMHIINNETGETIILASQNGIHSQYLRILHGNKVHRMHLYPGILRPLFNSGTGRMLVTSFDEKKILKLINQQNKYCAEGKLVDFDKIMRQREIDSENKYAISINKVTPYSGAIAALLPGYNESPPLVIGIAALSQQLVSETDYYIKIILNVINDLDIK